MDFAFLRRPLLLGLILFPLLSPAQQTAHLPSSDTSTHTDESFSHNTDEQEILRKEQSQRILGVVPMFGVTSRHNAPPLTVEQKLHLFVKGTFDPFQEVAVGFQAGISQANDEFPEYGQGAKGYAKRYGAAMADGVSSQFFSNFLYPVLLKEDPRYFRSGEGPVRRRLLYSLAQEFVCHTDKGGRSFNWSNVLGAFSTGGLSNTYYPQSDRGFQLTMSRSGIALLYGSAGGLIEEFWPDIQRNVFHKKHRLQ